MSRVTGATLEKADWVEELQRKVFDECAAQSRDQNSAELVSSCESSPPTTTAITTTADAVGDVPVSVIVSNIDHNFAQIPHFRQRTEFLEELRKSLQRVARNNQVNWCEFRESSERWFLNLLNLLRQDGNNNIRLNHSDAPTEDSERDGLSMEEHSDANDDELNSFSMNQMDTVASCYSLNSSSMGFGTTDSMMESSEETDHMADDVAGIDLQVKIRRFNEETANLRDDLVRAEDTISTLERDLKMTKTALEQMTNKHLRLRKENEDQRDMLAEAVQREESCKLDLRKLEKAYSILQKKIGALEKENENIASLKVKVEALTNDNSEYLKQLADYKRKYDEKVIECGYLQEENNDLQSNQCQLEKSYEENLQHHQEKIIELQNLNAELQSKLNKSDNSSRFSLTPPPYNHTNAHIHSTPHNSSSRKLQAQDSLFSELKASGFNVDEAKVQELRDEISFYNEEIAILGQQLDEALQDIAASRNEICVPSVQLVEPDGIQTLKHKVTSLLDLVKSSSAAVEVSPLVSRMGEDSREKKPDVLPESTKTSCLADARLLFGSEKRESDLIGSVTSSMTSIAESKLIQPQYDRSDRSTSPLQQQQQPEAAGFIVERDEAEGQAREQEIIVPIVEALNRIIEIKGTDEEVDGDTVNRPPVRYPKQKSIFTTKTTTDWLTLIAEASKSNNLPSSKNIDDYLNSKAHVNARGDGPHHDLMKVQSPDGSPKPRIDTTTTTSSSIASDMKTLKSEFKDCSPSPDVTVSKLDTRFVTIRPVEKTYLVSPLVTSSEEKLTDLDRQFTRFSDTAKPSEIPYFPTPVHSPKGLPRRKLSVYHRSFDVDSLQQTPDSAETTTSGSGKRRSISTPDVQESEYAGFCRAKTILQPLETPPIARNQLLLTSYRCASNSSDSSSLSPSPKKDESSPMPPGIQDESYALLLDEEARKAPARVPSKPVVLAPTKFKLPDSTVSQRQTIEVTEERKARPIVAQGILQRNPSFGKISGCNAAEESKILSSSPNLKREEEDDAKVEVAAAATFTVNSCNVGSSTLSSEPKNASTIDIASSDNSSDCMEISDGVFAPYVAVRKDQTYTKDDTSTESPPASSHHRHRATGSATTAPVSPREESSSLRCGAATSCRLVDGAEGRSASRAPAAAVARAMSSGEDSSAESECDALRSAANKLLLAEEEEEVKKKKKNNNNNNSVSESSSVEGKRQQQLQKTSSPMLDCSVIEVDSSGKPVLGRRRSNSCTETPTREIKLLSPPAVNGVNKENSCQKVTSNSSPQEAIKEDESPKAFPSWTDERLQESGIASYPDIDSEISENLSEDELKKKYTAFSVGLGTDRMTLSKRMILSRRHRDQAEKNFNNEILRMQQDIKELAPLCVDSESLERVERARLQLDMVARCAHKISCSAETLGAVHQERRVSRAVLLADKYLQTLRAKCEKLANELAETKRILAENNIVLEENLSEMGDDVPRVRYRAVPNNNRTMMARRRASIATISRPLMGSNQDITKELPRQRNSVSGRVPGLRRPSLCYEVPKWEIEKLDRADSSSSIAELRDIFEQTESRRHSREENNNLIRTSINNLSTITSEHTEEEEVWSNTREDIVPELANDDEINSLEIRQQHGHPLVYWLLNKYTVWKPMIWCIFIAFLVGFFMDRVVSSSIRNGPPMSWWSIEEILNQYIQVDNDKHPVPRPI